MILDSASLLLISNGVLFFVVLVLMIVLIRLAANYTWHTGNFPKQTEIKWHILRLLIITIIIALLAGIANLFFG